MKTTIKSTHGVIRFSLKESIRSLELTPNKESLIMLHFASKGKRFKKSIGFKSSLSNWDKIKQRIKTGKGMMTNAYKINALMNDIQEHTENALSSMIKETGTIDLELLSHSVSCKINGSDEDKEIKEKQKLIKYSNNLLEGKKRHIKITTYRACKQTIKMLEKYEKKHHEILKFDNIDLKFYRSFVILLENENYSLNSIGKHIKNLKIFLNDAITNGITNNHIFKSRNFKVLRETTTEIYLTNEEIKTLAEKDFSNRPRIELARDIFLIGCYTGQRVSDYNGLTDRNIEIIDNNKFIKIKQQKTDTPVLIPVTKDIAKILLRYNNNFPPKLSEPILRENIKTACSTVGFKELISVYQTKAGKLIKQEIPKYKLVKTHTARRSFCTNYYVAGKPLQNIMLFSGHKTEREFLKYVRIEKKQEALSVLKSGFFD
ncbi:site-specific integrase [Olleya sp. UBA1516]|uniref:tyrosine-type recombinase/integrase n=1 Tax=Olleya sp. UBA1516 TaxID=1947013 RepID=UPI0025DB8631|nr:site-specific integrase [Olleya sp. UBA1516]|tara:strand:+ start:9336 stop:10628 length:1293 start_codon:yes stop_codon:yes gene_type:complete